MERLGESVLDVVVGSALSQYVSEKTTPQTYLNKEVIPDS